MKVAVVDCGSQKIGALIDLLAELGAGVQRIPLDDAATVLADAVVISGGPRLFTAEPGLVDAFSFLDDLRAPVLGICLGHQAIALRAGAEVFVGAERRELETITLERPHALIAGLPSEVRFVADHCEGVTLPRDFARLASSPHYENEILACDDRRRYGVQFHPEISGREGARLLSNFLRLAGINDAPAARSATGDAARGR